MCGWGLLSRDFSHEATVFMMVVQVPFGFPLLPTRPMLVRVSCWSHTYAPAPSHSGCARPSESVTSFFLTTMTVMKLIDEQNTMQEYWSMTSLRLSAMVSRTDEKPLEGNACSVVRILSFHMSNEVLRSTFLAAKSGVHY